MRNAVLALGVLLLMSLSAWIKTLLVPAVALAQVACAPPDQETPTEAFSFSMYSQFTTPSAIGGGYSYTCSTHVVNDGDVDLTTVLLLDSLSTWFTDADSVNVLVTPQWGPDADSLTGNSLFDGKTDFCATDSTDVIAPGDSGSIYYLVYFEPGTATSPIRHIQYAGATDPATGQPAFEKDTVEVYWPDQPQVSITKDEIDVFDRGTGTYDVDWELVVTNTSQFAESINVYDDVQTIFSAATSVNVDSVWSFQGHTIESAFEGSSTVDSIYDDSQPFSSLEADTIRIFTSVTDDAGTTFDNVAHARSLLGGNSHSDTTATVTFTLPNPPIIADGDSLIYVDIANRDSTIILAWPFLPTEMPVSQFLSDTWQVRDSTGAELATYDVSLFENNRCIYPNGYVRSCRVSFVAPYSGWYILNNTGSNQKPNPASRAGQSLNFDILVSFDTDGDGDWWDGDETPDTIEVTSVDWVADSTYVDNDVFTWRFYEERVSVPGDTVGQDSLWVRIWQQENASGTQKTFFRLWNRNQPDTLCFGGDCTSTFGRDYHYGYYWDYADVASNQTASEPDAKCEVRLVRNGNQKFRVVYGDQMGLSEASSDTMTIWHTDQIDTTALYSAQSAAGDPKHEHPYSGQVRDGEQIRFIILSGDSTTMDAISDPTPPYWYIDSQRWKDSYFFGVMDLFDWPAESADSLKLWAERMHFGDSGFMRDDPFWDDWTYTQQNAWHKNPRDFGYSYINSDACGDACGGAVTHHYKHMGDEYQFEKNYFKNWARAADLVADYDSLTSDMTQAYFYMSHMGTMCSANSINYLEGGDMNPTTDFGYTREWEYGWPRSHGDHDNEDVDNPHHQHPANWVINHFCPGAYIWGYMIHADPTLRDAHYWVLANANRRAERYEVTQAGNGSDDGYQSEKRASAHTIDFWNAHMLYDCNDLETENHWTYCITFSVEETGNDPYGWVSGDYSQIATERSKPWMNAMLGLRIRDAKIAQGLMGNASDSITSDLQWGRIADWLTAVGTVDSCGPCTATNPWDTQAGAENSLCYEHDLNQGRDGCNAPGAWPWGIVAAGVMAGRDDWGDYRAHQIFHQSLKYPSGYDGDPPSNGAPGTYTFRTRENFFRMMDIHWFLTEGQHHHPGAP